MRVDAFRFGSIRIDGNTYEHDVVVADGEVRKRDKKPSKRHKESYGHTPLSLAEDIPWDCDTLVIGTGVDGALPVMNEVKKEAERRGVDLSILPTARAIEQIRRARDRTNAILHVTC